MEPNEAAKASPRSFDGYAFVRPQRSRWAPRGFRSRGADIRRRVMMKAVMWIVGIVILIGILAIAGVLKLIF